MIWKNYLSDLCKEETMQKIKITEEQKKHLDQLIEYVKQIDMKENGEVEEEKPIQKSKVYPKK